ncbi:MAG: hypothetical protein N2Z74_00570 [Syntrophales bacterium]|nr:hypothetical protein [Syntrophales bacterium]
MTVGIDIGHNRLRIVVAARTTQGHWQVQDRRSLSLPVNVPRESAEFRTFLKTAISPICGMGKKTELWAIMSAARVEVRHIRIPKVPKKQISNTVYWTVKKESAIDEKEFILDYEFQGEIIEQGIPKYTIMVYTAPRDDVEALKDLFNRIGCPLTGITIVPFAMQNLLRSGWIPSHDRAVATLFIGNEFSRIDIYAGHNLVMTRGIKAGLSSMAEQLVDVLNDRIRAGEINRGEQFTIEDGYRIIRTISPDTSPLAEDEAGHGLSREDIFSIIQPALERLIRQVERTYEYFATTPVGDRIDRMFVSGAMNFPQLFVDFIAEQLSMRCDVLDPLGWAGNESAVPAYGGESITERIAFTPALGVAFSGNDHTPNMLFTYKDKEREAAVSRINKAVFITFITLTVLCSAVFGYQNFAAAQKRKLLGELETKLMKAGPAFDRNDLSKLSAKINERRQYTSMYARRYLGVAILGELAELTPPNVRFTDLKINLGPVPPKTIPTSAVQEPPKTGSTGGAAGTSGQANPKATPTEEILVEGVITGNRQDFETTMAGYLMALESSPMFRQVIVQKSTVIPYFRGEALQFNLKLLLEAQVS